MNYKISYNEEGAIAIALYPENAKETKIVADMEIAMKKKYPIVISFDIHIATKKDGH